MKKLFTLSCFILSLISVAAFAGPVPDTGQSKCYGNTLEIACPQPGEPFYGQDAQYTINPHSYTKLGYDAVELPDNATEWIMVRDNVTGLIWEVKTDDGSINDRDYACQWEYVQDFIPAVNSENFGGFSDWRMPTVKELSFIRNMDRFNPAIDTIYFPNIQALNYWSSTTVAEDIYNTWIVYFYNGYAQGNNKSHYSYVRAVRAGQAEPPDRFMDNSDGTVTDTDAGLMWQQATAPGTYTWEQAVSYCEGLILSQYDDWRLPSLNELQTLVDYERSNPAIDTAYFPDIQASYYWSSTSIVYSSSAWNVDFFNGSVYGSNKSGNEYVRAVRAGQCGALGDFDGDGICDDGDNSTVAGDNPCGNGETLNCDDNCVNTPNPAQADRDNDTIGDACDNCPDDFNLNQEDADSDGTGDICDNCTDTDNDGLGDPGFPLNTCLLDDCPYDSYNDFDNDSFCGNADNCPFVANPAQTDSDNDTIGNACDICPNDPLNDFDNDTICGDIDICPLDPLNDFDNDTMCGDMDNCPETPNGSGTGTCVKLTGGVFIGTGVSCLDFNDCEDNELCDTYQLDLNDNSIGNACECYADCDNSTKVDIFDLLVMKNDYGRPDCPCDADLNDDGLVDIFDLLIMKNQYNRTGCPALP